MGRPAKAFCSGKYGCWVTAALGEVQRTKAERTYRPLTRFEDLRHPTRDHRVAQARLDAELRKGEASVVMGDDITFGHLSEFYLEDGEKSGRWGPEAYDRAGEHLNRFGSSPAADDPARMDVVPCRCITADDVEGLLNRRASSWPWQKASNLAPRRAAGGRGNFCPRRQEDQIRGESLFAGVRLGLGEVAQDVLRGMAS